jgi:protein-L-isoaspartate(D-aspartate) O-methyltransferase
MPPEAREAALSAAREKMVESQLHARGISDPRVLQAMRRVPRHDFVDEDFRRQAYEDHPLPISSGQTVSQPYIVAITLQALRLESSHIALEIGTGSGYQTALLAELCRHVYSIERYASLARQAQATLDRLGYRNLTVVVGDGAHGLAQSAPFDAIVVSAASPQIPPDLLDQLREGGRMVIPVGPPEVQELQLVHKQPQGAAISGLEACRFVPLVSS